MPKAYKMKQIADLHIHSRFSRACSKNLTLENLDKTCRKKGIDILGTGDFTFPDWYSEMTEELEEIGSTGIYKLKTRDDDNVKFTLSTELALVYKKGDRARRVHICVQAPNLEAVKKLNNYLDKDFNIRSDGRPILGMSIEKMCELCFGIDPKFLIYPAHIWTPWFAIFGSKSGFDSWEEAFGEYSDQIYAYETGLSSDPEMNWRVSELDSKTLLSNSDAHSLPNLAREANVFDLETVSYDEFFKVIKNKQSQKEDGSWLDYTIEFYPEEGMYHLDGHRDCGIRLTPGETKKNKGICPKCKKKLTVGVDYRVSELADNETGRRPENVPGFKKLVELDKIIAEALGIKSRTSKKVQVEYDNLIDSLGKELDILLEVGLQEIENIAGKNVAEGIRRVRAGELSVEPGFDGQYGVVKIFSEEEVGKKQKKLF